MPHSATPRPRRGSRWVRVVLALALVYFLIAYVLLPKWWERHERKHPAQSENPTLTHTGTGIPGDPLNVSLVGEEEDVLRAMIAAKWVPADPLTFRSSVRIAVDTVFKIPDENAPVSNLYLFGRKEDLAFEKPAGGSPKERHHVRFWRTAQTEAGRPVWLGSAAFDIGVELSRTTGEVTHHIAADVDAERDLLLADLGKANRVLGTRWIEGFHKERQGRNGGGDPWHTDGRLPVVTLATGNP